MLPKQIIFAMVIQATLMVLTMVLLVPPKALANRSEWWKTALKAGGWASLCITFCWSVILGIILTLNHYTLSI